MTFATGTDAAGVANNPAGESVHTSIIAYDSLGVPLTRRRDDESRKHRRRRHDLALHRREPRTTATTRVFDSRQRRPARRQRNDSLRHQRPTDPGEAGNTITVSRAGTGADQNVDIALNFEKVTALASSDSTLFAQQDGIKIGSLVGFEVGGNGIITGTFDNGLTSVLGQVATATFDNPQGLNDHGSNLYAVGSNSGEPRIGGPLEGQAGGVRSGALELSNVDLSNEFINLIIASTGFSAASRVITTSDQLMQELLNTARDERGSAALRIGKWAGADPEPDHPVCLRLRFLQFTIRQFSLRLMILLTRLNGSEFVFNAEKIRAIESDARHPHQHRRRRQARRQGERAGGRQTLHRVRPADAEAADGVGLVPQPRPLRENPVGRGRFRGRVRGATPQHGR